MSTYLYEPLEGGRETFGFGLIDFKPEFEDEFAFNIMDWVDKDGIVDYVLENYDGS